MIKKFSLIFAIVLCFFMLANVEAASQSKYIDMQTYMDVYKLSEDSEVKLPFIKFFNEKASFDKKLDKSGLTVAANSVEIKEAVNGLQFIIGADTINIEGNMEYSVMCASNVDISGTIEKDVLIVAESVFITETANILGDIVVVADSIEMKGTVQGNFIAGSNKFLMEGKVGKDFRVRSNDMTFNENDIKGEIYIETETELELTEKYENAVVNKIQNNSLTEAQKKERVFKIVISIITSSILFTLLNMVVRKIKPELFKKLTNKTINHPSFTVIGGVVLLTTIPIFAVLGVICSMFGLGVATTPLFVIYIATIIVVIALSKFIVGSTLFEILKEKIKVDNKIKEILLLLSIFALLYILSYVPHIAWFVTVAIVLLSAGITTTNIMKKE